MSFGPDADNKYPTTYFRHAFEVPAPAAGTITELRAAEGDVVPVGSVIFVLDSGGGAPAAEPAPEAAAPAPAAAPSGGGGATLEFKLPDIGEGIAEGEIVKWLVSAGDSVEEHQAVVEVMTDKATVEVPSPAAGTISALGRSLERITGSRPEDNKMRVSMIRALGSLEDQGATEILTSIATKQDENQNFLINRMAASR